MLPNTKPVGRWSGETNMPCNDSSSSIDLKIDQNELFVSFDFAKITCGREITAKTGYSEYCKNKPLEEILKLPYQKVVAELNIQDEEGQFILFLEWDALRSAIAQYLGIEDIDIDRERCIITSVESTAEGTNVALVILPPKEMPKIIACGLAPKEAEKN